MKLPKLKIAGNQLHKINAGLAKGHVSLNKITAERAPSDVVRGVLRLSGRVLVADMEARMSVNWVKTLRDQVVEVETLKKQCVTKRVRRYGVTKVSLFTERL